MAEVNTPSEASAELARVVEAIERLAFTMPPPNDWTPQFVQLAQIARHLIPALSSHGGGGEAVPNGKLVGWWNGISPGFDGEGNWSVRWGADGENSAHDIPLYDGYNPVHYLAPPPQPRAEGMVLPEKKVVPYGSASGEKDYGYGYEKGHADGWNACRAAMLAAAPGEGGAPCETCNGHGMIDTSSGQTPDTYQQDAMPCPDCATPSPASQSATPSDAVDWRGLYRLQTAMRYMDNSAALTTTDAYRMADQDIAAAERSNRSES